MDSRNHFTETTMNLFSATLAMPDGVEVTINTHALHNLTELVAHIELFKPGSVAAAHRGLANVLAEDNPETGTDTKTLPLFPETLPRSIDPAVAFGGAAAPLPPASAPSTVAAALAPSAPVAPPAISPSTPIADAAPAPMPAPPAAAQTEHAAPTSLAERDADGVPWDFRIHAESKAKVADGTWRKRRNLADGLHEQITAELKALAGVSPAMPSPPAAAAAPTPAPAVSSYADFMNYLNTVMIGANPKLTIDELSASIATTGDKFGLEQRLTLQSLKHANEVIQTAARLAVEAYVAAKP